MPAESDEVVVFIVSRNTNAPEQMSVLHDAVTDAIHAAWVAGRRTGVPVQRRVRPRRA